MPYQNFLFVYFSYYFTEGWLGCGLVFLNIIFYWLNDWVVKKISEIKEQTGDE
jgi:hypothetical protein